MQYCSKDMLFYSILGWRALFNSEIQLGEQILQAIIYRVWGLEASYMRTKKFSIILMLDSEGFDMHESLITNRLYEVFLNV